MKIAIYALIVSIFSLILIACEKPSNERSKAMTEKLKGNVQETVGNITNDDEVKQEAKKNKLKGDLRSTKEDMKDIFTK